MSSKQSARSVLMVSPSSFEYDHQTALSNSFMTEPDIDAGLVTQHANEEFRHAVNTLRAADINVIVYDSDPQEYKPSAVFPNNWISTWPDGNVYTYPMATASRRGERDSRIIDMMAKKYTITHVSDISEAESQGQHLESTGAIVFDHLNKIAYGCISERCDETLFTQHVEDLGYQPVAFRGYDKAGDPIYHTNVMLAIQSTTAVICYEAIRDPAERELVQRLLGNGRNVVDITFDQLSSFCGNVLEVENRHGKKYLIASESAYSAYTDSQRELLSQDKKILVIRIPMIESASGGSIRCMLAEIFLPPIPIAPTTQSSL